MSVRRSLASAIVLAVPGVAAALMPVFPDVASPDAYGRVILDARSREAGIPGAVFDHWLHRSLYSCRLCHVEAAFAMATGESQVSRETNSSDLHCGACHNGRTMNRGKPIFPACSPSGPFEEEACSRCHFAGGPGSRRTRYSEFTQGFPKYAGGYVEWDVAEGRGLIMPADFVEGISLPRNRFKIDRDVPIEVKGTWLGNVTFSHRKHVVWNGCETCHPEIFPATKRGSVKFTMADVYAGKYCGVCHRTVAFPLAQCKRCHETGDAARRGR